MERSQPRKITRNREFRACIECRKRKLKCDRQTPCGSCIRRNDASCAYEHNAGSLQSEHSHRVRVEAKLQHLEKLVRDLDRSPNSASGRNGVNDADGNVDANPAPRVAGEMTVNTLYNGATHWSAMLDNIEELRNAIDAQDRFESAEMGDGDDSGISLLFGGTEELPLVQIISQLLPPRIEVDRLVSSYFRGKAVVAPFIHTIYFRRCYQQFWDNPLLTSPLWISILFSILDIATNVLPQNSNSNHPRTGQIGQFATAAAHCLVTGRYAIAQKFAPEALLLFVQAICLKSIDIPPITAILLGTLARLTTSMGYHRDADDARGRLTAFEGEMRRRTWSLYMQLDMLISFQLGLPSNVQSPTWNTKPPTNIFDSDFNEDTVELPRARPDSEPTELVFYIAKHKLMAVFEKVLRHSLSASESTEEELAIIDQELRCTYMALPQSFIAQDMADSIVDPPSVVVARLCVFFIYQKSLCVLHRKHIIQGVELSIQTCFDSSSALVRRFLDVYKEFEPGGQLETQQWFMGSLSWHDFLLGCTVLCLSVCATAHGATKEISSRVVNVGKSVDLLRNTSAVFETRANSSKDTRKVQRLVAATVSRFVGTSDCKNIMKTSPHDSASSWQLGEEGSHDGGNRMWDDGMPAIEDQGWDFMQEFLDLPNDDFMMEIVTPANGSDADWVRT